MKTQLKNNTQTIFQGGSPWATLILNSMFVVGVLHCVQLLFEVKIFKISLSFPSPFLRQYFFVFTFLVPFFWNSQNA